MGGRKQMGEGAEPAAGPAVAETQFTHTLVYRRTERWAGVDPAEAAREVRAALACRPGVSVRGVYSTAGLRPDADTAFRLLAELGTQPKVYFLREVGK